MLQVRKIDSADVFSDQLPKFSGCSTEHANAVAFDQLKPSPWFKRPIIEKDRTALTPWTKQDTRSCF